MAQLGSVDLRVLFNSNSKTHWGQCHGNVTEILENGLLGHCVLCLRQLSENVPVVQPSGSSSLKSEGERLKKEVPKAVVTQDLVSAFNEVWKSLRTRRKKKGHDGAGEGEQDINLENIMRKGGSSTLEIFSSTPFICQFCGDAVQIFGKILKGLRSQLTKVVKIITESRKGGKYSWRVGGFEAKLRECSLEREILNGTVNLLNSICSSEISVAFTPVREDPKTPSSFEFSSQLNLPEATSPAATVKTECSDDDLGPTLESSGEFGEADPDDNLSDDNPQQKDSDYIKTEPEDYQKEEKANLTCKYSKLHINNNSIDAFAPPPPLNVAELILTLVKIKKRGSKFLCPKENCEEIFFAKSNLIIHMQIKHPEEITALEKNRCTCGKIFKSEELLSQHVKTDKIAHPPPIIPKEKLRELQQKRRCDMCGKTVRNLNMFKHLTKHVGTEYIVKCPNKECIKMYSNSTALKHHLTRLAPCQQEAERQNIGLSCETCGFKAEHRISLRSHVEHVHEMGAEKTLNCPIRGCVKMFSVRQAVDLHLYFHNLRNVKKQKCDQCSEVIKFEEIEEHLKTSHNCNDVIKCQLCPFRFSLRDNLLEHLHEHHRHSSGGLECDICNDGVKFIIFRDFRDHYHSVHKVGRKKWTCEQCNEAFWLKCVLNNHIKKKHSLPVSSSEKKKKMEYPCDLCDSVRFSTRRCLQHHKIKIHGAKPYTCDICGDTFNNGQKFSLHRREHGGANLRNFKCEVEGCGKVFNDNKMLKRHKLVGHSGGGGKNYVCDLCGKAYYDAPALRYHHDIVHLGLRPFICEECGEGFVSQLVLRNHKRIHTGERPFSCEICDQRFRHKVVLQKHLEGHEKKGAAFRPNGPMKKIRKRKVK